MKNKIEIYSTSKCHYCDLLKKYLIDNNLEFTVHDVGTDLAKRKEMVDVSGQMGVPVSVIDGEVLVGFDEEKIKKALGIKK